MSPVPIYTPGWRETKWSKVSCLRKQRDGRTRLEPRTSRSGIRGGNHSATHASISYDHATCKISSLFHFREGVTYLGQNENDHKTTTTFYCLNYISMVTGVSHRLFSSYLDNRTQKCVVNGSLSECCTLQCGIPQGTILGPLLFLLYINDLPNCLSHSVPRMYADDNHMYISNWPCPIALWLLQCGMG